MLCLGTAAVSGRTLFQGMYQGFVQSTDQQARHDHLQAAKLLSMIATYALLLPPVPCTVFMAVGGRAAPNPQLAGPSKGVLVGGPRGQAAPDG